MDFTTLLVIGLIVVVVVLLLSRNRRVGSGGPIYSDQIGGVDRPTYDDPGYTSSGSIGGSAVEPPAQERNVGGASDGNRPTHDDPNYRSGGSIGG
jgi:hypothetical protein